MANVKIVQRVQICGVLQFVWHYVNVVKMGVTFWPTWYFHLVKTSTLHYSETQFKLKTYNSEVKNRGPILYICSISVCHETEKLDETEKIYK